jgi:hypothetical protein
MMTDEFQYSNGANGSCQECGEATEEEWHVYCSGCYAEQQGWRRPDRDALRWQHEDREQVALTEIVARLEKLEVMVRRLERERAT